ncbi:helix-turn-helix domain-containing protein [Sphingosinicella sp. CPCC 101087]|uniref:helix-turn-helix domain-containing protein n=1 Tax=Sphingosinicella sp. CPCC 101087 TaxID=2497754 RepID=UPI00101D2272|nr:helix-turn-helix domain-containing protein [Sphingosinicella sp. CPCC 101087]
MAEQEYETQFQTASIGERLKKAREAKGLALEDVASQTRIPIRHLQHIENEEWDALPAVTYCVGFVRSYGNAVGLDGAELGRELRDKLGGLRSRAPVAEYYEPADPARVPPLSLALIAAALLVVLIIGYLVWRSSLDAQDQPAATVTLPPAEAPAAAGSAGPAPAAQPQTLAGQPVTLAATEEVWVRIEDQAEGGTLFQGIMAPGQRYAIPPAAQQPVIRTARPQVLRVLIGDRDIGPLEPVERTVADVSLRPEALAARLQQAAPPATAAPVPPQ